MVSCGIGALVVVALLRRMNKPEYDFSCEYLDPAASHPWAS
ncbi:hypothetical protein CCYS_12985 [Corynebacterium cystitidis DSM 20524]|uniref:Uncharacterized protein n=1 Tax=Corynebacterium cystitidis DSM 20524 TaxID=1121357 RepID=A0A1H9T712_9CORY|nr:hypothetical protein CCYS_12985 [Corynebacterium cystitidis DSM 20524]SER92916.1 hypothetical protein SAMN05661109_01339 [Corynebacterium cystitidis DSM 20524]SNV92569.1 Uncharacterised protein [Corynebacterium cystitidis]